MREAEAERAEAGEDELLLSVAGLSMELGGKLVLSRVNMELRRGERWAILGNSGSGKTALASAIAGKAYCRGRIEWRLPEGRPASLPAALVEQEIRFGPASGGPGYYQQRYNASEAEEGPSLREVLALSPGGLAAALPWAQLLQLTPLLERPVLQLSSGERRRAQIARALAGGPSLLILDDPFTALDVQGREILLEALGRLGRGKATFLLFQSRGEVPDFITQVAELSEGTLSEPVPRIAYVPRTDPAPRAEARRLPPALLSRDAGAAAPSAAAGGPAFGADFRVAFRLVDAVVRYGEVLALDRVSWEVERGERWSLTGPNGAGKTSLLSLITADHPQAYANELYLFDRRRGSGETIWDIKERIGFVSPELHAAFPRDATVGEVVASGLFDSIGLYRRPDAEEERRVVWWLEAVGVAEGRARALSDLPLGAQRMLLLARALVKRPPLLILDEPCQGLDAGQAGLFLGLLDAVCAASETTMIYVSHVEAEIPDCVTKSLRLEAGRVVYRGERGR
jgi:molybdate transport system ATP-binding protein